MNLVPAAALLVGCAGGDEERPPRLGDDCGGIPCPGPGFSGGAVGGGGDDVGAQPGDAAPDGEGTIAGAVRVFQNETFSSTVPFVGTGTIGAEGAAGRVTESFTDDSYQLSGLPSSGEVWVDLEATATTQDVMSTLSLLDVAASSQEVVFVQAAIMESIAQGLLVPENLSSSRGHAVLIFEDSTGSPLAGIEIVDHPGTVVAYDTGSGLFRDDFDQTSQRGAVAILNAETVALPGRETTIVYGGAASGSVDVKLAQNATTFLTVVP